MSDDAAENQGAPDVRSKAMQDLEVVSARRREAEQRVLELRAEEVELEAFIRRLDRYDPRPDENRDIWPPAASVEELNRRLRAEAISNHMKLVASAATAHRFRPPAFGNAAGAAASAALTATAATSTAEAAVAASAALASTTANDAQASSAAPTGRSGSAAAASAQALLAASAPVSAASASAPAGLAVASGQADDLRFAHNMAGARALAARVRHRELPSLSSRRGRIGSMVAHLMDLTGPTTTKWLADALRARPELYGFLGVKPEATLSSYLSRDPRFLFDQENRVWTLVSNRQSEGVDQDDADPDGAREERGVS